VMSVSWSSTFSFDIHQIIQDWSAYLSKELYALNEIDVFET
jgi:hypothetical protein